MVTSPRRPKARSSGGSSPQSRFATRRLTKASMDKAVDALLGAKLTLTDFVLHLLQGPNVTDDAKHMLLWLVTADRPLLLKELELLASIQVDHGGGP